MYESMLSRVPRYSVWPHFRRMMSSVPTLCEVLVSEYVYICTVYSAGEFALEDVPGLEERARVEGLELWRSVSF